MFPFTARTFADVAIDPPRHVVIDPEVAFGRPVVDGTGITTAVLFERFSAGESMPDLAEDYGIEHLA